VLAQLLDGSGYNVLIVGDRGQGAPRRIVLSVRPAAGSQPAAPAYQPAQNDGDADADQQPQDQQPEEPPPPQANPAPVPGRPMGDFMQQQRQLQMQQMQQQQQLQPQQQPPPQQPQNPQN